MGSDGGPAPSRGRDPFWDTLRFVAITLVVVGHTIEGFRTSDLMYALYVFIYAFHMPLFAFVSGRFSSARPPSAAALVKLVSTLVVPYLVFSCVWVVVRWAGGEGLSMDLAAPYWILWFLFALLLWRLALPVVAVLRWPVACGVAIGLAAGYMHTVGYGFSGGRVLGMFPFFVIGWALRERGLPVWLQQGQRTLLAVRAAAVAGLLTILAVVYLDIDWVRRSQLRSWTHMDCNYASSGVPEWWGGGVRLGLYVLAAVMIAAVLVLVPRRRSVLSERGAATMYVYLLHAIPIYLLKMRTPLLDWFDSAPRLLLAVLLGVALSWVLSGRVVRTATRPLVEPRTPWLFRRDLAPTGR